MLTVRPACLRVGCDKLASPGASYCSPECVQKDRRKPPTRKLCARDECTKPAKRGAVYCSPECRPKDTRAIKLCLICGKPCKDKGRTYCSQRCAFKGARDRRNLPQTVNSILIFDAIKKVSNGVRNGTPAAERDRVADEAREKAKKITTKATALRGKA